MRPTDSDVLRGFVKKNYPGKGYVFKGNTRPISSLEGLEVIGVTHDLTISDFNTFKTSELEDYDSKQYQRDRQYPSIGDQLDMIYWDKKIGTNKWKESIDAVKAKNPKP